MSYSYVEKKRIRKKFGNLNSIIEVPYLLDTQLNSYKTFLQRDVEQEKRKNVGLQAAFKSVFPISSLSNHSELHFIKYNFDEIKFNEQECKVRGTTYSIPLKVTLKLIIFNKMLYAEKKIVEEERTLDCFMGELPLMTEHGTFIINGTERVVVSQLHRSPGVFFDHDNGKHSSDKILYSAHVIPYRGSWLDFEFDTKDLLFARIDKHRKIPITTFLKALNFSDDELLKIFYEPINFTMNENKLIMTGFLPENFKGTRSEFIVLDEDGNTVIQKGKRITEQDIRLIKNKNILSVEVPISYLNEKIIYEPIFSPIDNEIIAKTNEKINDELLEKISSNKLKSFKIINTNNINRGAYISNTLCSYPCLDNKEALVDIYRTIRPGEPPTKDSADSIFKNLFFNENRYNLSEVGRMKFNVRLGRKSDTGKNTLSKTDILDVIKELIDTKDGNGTVDDIDHLVNRRIRAVGEMTENHFRIGLLRAEKSIREKLSIVDRDNMVPQDLINAKPISASVKEFFTSSALSQFMDQDNPLSEITHKRRISALGPGGLSRERAGFEVRDVHATHYGRLCPIETPEGPNVGLISSLASYAKINRYGFLETPYRQVINGKVTDNVEYLSAIDETNYLIAQASATISQNFQLTDKLVQCRYQSEVIFTAPEKVNYMDVSTKQIASIAASLIPFLEHDDANRALMGSNMQRQAVPVLIAEKPLVGTGMERVVAKDSGTCAIAKRAGTVHIVDSRRIVIKVKTNKIFDNNDSLVDIYNLTKFKRSNKNTCINQRPLVKQGDVIVAGDILADGSSTDMGELALGQNLLVAFMPWNGFNFEDSILLSERVAENDRYTSIHIEELSCIARDTKLGPEEITADIPNINEHSLNKLDDCGIVYIGANVKPGDILVAKITPKAEQQLTPEEKLLRAVFGEKASDVKDNSLRVPAGMFGTVIDIKIFTREGIEKDARSSQIEESDIENIRKDLLDEYNIIKKTVRDHLSEILPGQETQNIAPYYGQILVKENIIKNTLDELLSIQVKDENVAKKIEKSRWHVDKAHAHFKEKLENKRKKIVHGNELSPGVLKIVKVFVAVKKRIQAGDKMAGRHGNKGVVSMVLPIEDMPFLEDGTPVDIVLNPLGVPSRMNIGQILETHMGLAAHALGRKIKALTEKTDNIEDIKSCLEEVYNASGHKKVNLSELNSAEIIELSENLKTGVPISTPVFDGAKEDDIKDMLRSCNLPESGQMTLYDGRTGQKFDRPITIGYIYMLKLDHLVDDKMHARSTGSYSLVTQQPLGGRAQFGGQRFGEMEVWALQAYGAAYSLREMLTVKSDDVTGRTRMYKNIIDGNCKMDASIPESFNVLTKEVRALGIDIDLKYNTE